MKANARKEPRTRKGLIAGIKRLSANVRACPDLWPLFDGMTMHELRSIYRDYRDNG